MCYWRRAILVCFLTVATATVCKTTTTIDPVCNDWTCGWDHANDFQATLGNACVFPFLYKNVTYSSCTTMDHHRPWCATVALDGDVSGTGYWGNCEEDSCLQTPEAQINIPCSQIPTCCSAGFTETDVFTPPVIHQATYIAGVDDASDRDDVMDTVLALDPQNHQRSNRRFSMLPDMFLAELNPIELGFLLNDSRTSFVECNTIVTAYTSQQGRASRHHLRGGGLGSDRRDDYDGHSDWARIQAHDPRR